MCDYHMTQQLLSWVFIPEKRWLLFIQKRAHRYLQLLFCNSRTPQTTQMRFPGGMGRRPAVHPYRGTRPPWYEWCCPQIHETLTPKGDGD